jgi:large subunit ribosomal protein L25
VAETKTLKAEIRAVGGTNAARRVRKQGKLPGVVYGHGEEPVAIALDVHDFAVELHHGAHLLSVDLNGKPVQCLIKQVQYDHLGENVLHVDLARVDLTERVKVKVGIELRGTPKGLSEGGLLDQSLANVEIECLVTEIPDVLRPSVAHLHLGESLLVRDLELPPSGRHIHDPEDIVATVRKLAEEVVEAAPAVAAEAEAAPAEPEVIRKVREEEPEE